MTAIITLMMKPLTALKSQAVLFSVTPIIPTVRFATLRAFVTKPEMFLA